MKSTKMMFAAAAMGGLIAGSATLVSASTSTGARSSFNASPNSPRTMVSNVKVGAKAVALDGDKHDCKGMNDCKGKGGCKTGDNGCKGKNSCKGKGGCKVSDAI